MGKKKPKSLGVWPAVKPFANGGASGMLATCVIQPIDMIKAPIGIGLPGLKKPKPCWSCRGCSRSVYIMELCSGSRIAGFERIKTLLQRTSFTQAIPGFKVLIIKKRHSFNVEAWDELLGMVERGHGSRVVIVLITADANMVPTNISSRCQKFCFPKLKKDEMTLKLAKIVACEGIRIDKEALKLIIAKAEGSLREAENLLDQLALLGSTITSSMVQQLLQFSMLLALLHYHN